MKEDRMNVTEFILIGLRAQLQKTLISRLLISYIVTVMGNLLTGVTVIGTQTLDFVVYFLLAFCL